jgi:1-acyl-sn-glycerol-3-phosphate acyltransferase
MAGTRAHNTPRVFQFRGMRAPCGHESVICRGQAYAMFAALRLSRVAVHVLLALDAALAFGRLSREARQSFLRWWARGLLAALGVRLRVIGEPMPVEPALIVANHVSWLDVIAILATRPASFVCKSEVAAWPAIGWLLKRAGTIFIRRGSFRDVWRVNIALRERFDARQSVAAFPEGTTTYGDQVLEFRPALFQPALERALAVRPVAISYSSAAAAYVGDSSFAASLYSICSARGLEVRLTLLPPLAPSLSRREAARAARLAIAEALGLGGFSSGGLRPGGAAGSSTSRATPRLAARPSPLARPSE